MGEECVLSEDPESVTNGKAEEVVNVVEKTEDVTENSEEQCGGVKEMEEDKGVDGKVEARNLDVDIEKVNKSKNIEERGTKEREQEKIEEAKGQEKQGTVPEEAKEHKKSQEMVGDSGNITKRGNEDKVKEEYGTKAVEEKPEESKEEKSWKKRPRSKISSGKQDKSKKKNSEEHTEKEPRTPTDTKAKDSKTMVEKKELKTPVTPMIERPVRERKSVERLVAAIDKDSAKEFHVEKGRGTALKDIPKVAYKLSRKKNEDTFQLLHTILFGRRGKAAQVKNNISRFSGFVWHGNEEKQLIKVREKLEKFVKEKLVEFCDVLDLPISNAKKEDIISNLIEFLEAPHATSTGLLAEEEQSSKGKKRKRTSKSASHSDTPAKGSAKSRKKIEGGSRKGRERKRSQHEAEEVEEANEDEGVNGVAKKSDVNMSEQTETEKKESDLEKKSDEDKGKKKPAQAKSSVQKRSAEKAKNQEVTISKKARSPPIKTLQKSPPSHSSTYKRMSAKKSSGKNTDESVKKLSSPKKSASQESIGKKVLKVKVDKPAEEKSKISDVDIRNVICEILTEVDFNKATFNDILKILAKRFDMDLTSRKSSIKTILQAELTKLVDAGDAENEEDEGEVDKDKEKKPPSQGVKA